MTILRPAERSIYFCLALAVALFSLAPATASAVDVMAGWTHSDVGLDGKEDGITFSFSHYLPMGESGTFDMGLELAYVQRSGSQTAFFYSETLGPYIDEGKVRLHILQPGVTMGYSLDLASVTCRLYAGGALGLKMDESWILAEGDWLDPYGYENLDYLALVGLGARIGSVVLDVRYCAGLSDQLILRNELDTDKAYEDPLPGVKDPENGASLSNIQIGVGIEF